SMWCSTMSTVQPCSRCTVRMTSTSSPISPALTPAMGSSSRMTRGSRASSSASSSLRLSPWDRSPASASARWESRTRSKTRLISGPVTGVARCQKRRDSPNRAWTARPTFAPTDRSAKTLEVWKVRPRPRRALRCGGSRVMSVPSSSTVPRVGRVSPDTRLNSEVFPAPLGPMTARNSPSETVMDTPSTMTAPPTDQLRSLRTRTGAGGEGVGEVITSLRDWGFHVGGRDFRDQFGDSVCAAADQPHLVHGLEERVVFRPDGQGAFHAFEGPAFQGFDPLLGGVAFRDGVHDHLRGGEPVGGEQVYFTAVVFDEFAHHLLGFGLRGPVEVVGEEGDLAFSFAEHRVGRFDVQSGDDLGGVEDPLLVEGLPHGGGGLPRPRHEQQVRVGLADLFRERGQVGGVGRGEDTVHGGALGFEDGGDRVHVVLAERVLLGEDDDVLAFGVVHARTRGENVLIGLAAGTECVVVDAGD